MIWIFYIIGFVAIFGLISLITWWLRYAVAVMYMLMPAMCVFWFIWAWFVAVPVGLIADGSALDRKVMAISHWFNDATWELIKFCLMFPFNLFIWSADIVTWIAKSLGWS